MSEVIERLKQQLREIADPNNGYEDEDGYPMFKDGAAWLEYIEQLEKDAARYQFVRNIDIDFREFCSLAGESLDEAIDTALSRTKE